MTDLSDIPWNKFPADAAPNDLVSKNFQLYELTKSDITSRLVIPNNFSSAVELRCAVYLHRNVMHPVRKKSGRYSPNSVYRSQALEHKPADWGSDKEILSYAKNLQTKNSNACRAWSRQQDLTDEMPLLSTPRTAFAHYEFIRQGVLND